MAIATWITFSMCSLLVKKKKKKVAGIVQTAAPCCVTFIQHTFHWVSNPIAFRLLPGSFQSCTQQISRIFCVEVRVWYICSKSTSITQPTGKRWKEREIRRRTNFFPSLKIASVQWATVVFVKRIRSPPPLRVRRGTTLGSRWEKNLVWLFGGYSGSKSFEQIFHRHMGYSQIKQSISCEG